MRFLVTFRIPIERGNELLQDPEKFGATMKEIIAEMNAEAVYFGPVHSQRGGYIILDLEDASKVAVVAEPLLHYLQADLEWVPLMRAEDLAKAGPSIAAAVKKWA